MAQNITLLGASYSDVPSVDLPKTGGGTARFTDTTDANATASDIAEGKTAYVNDVKVVGTASGGGGTTWATGTFTPSSATTSVTFDTTLTTIHGILIVPTSASPFTFSTRTQVGMIVTPDCYYKSISLHSNQGGTGFQTPSGSTSNSRMTQNGTSVTITAPYNFRAMSYTWFAW